MTVAIAPPRIQNAPTAPDLGWCGTPHLVVAEPAVAIDGALSTGCSLGGCVPEFEDEDARDEEQRTADEEDLKDRHRRSVGATRDCGAVWAFLAGFMRAPG